MQQNKSVRPPIECSALKNDILYQVNAAEQSQGCVWDIDATAICCFSMFVLVMVIVSLDTF